LIDWGAVGAIAQIIGLVAIPLAVLGLIYSKRQLQVKELTIQYLVNSPAVTIRMRLEGLKILLNDREIKSLNVVLVRIINSGNIAIKKSDYEHDTKIEVGKDAKIFIADVYRTEPKNLIEEVETSADDTSMSIKPLLLNKGEWIELSMIVENPNKIITANARIADTKVKETNKLDLEKPRNPSNRLFSIIIPGLVAGILTLALIILLRLLVGVVIR
jgi:hypothetical protein